MTDALIAFTWYSLQQKLNGICNPHVTHTHKKVEASKLGRSEIECNTIFLPNGFLNFSTEKKIAYFSLPLINFIRSPSMLKNLLIYFLTKFWFIMKPARSPIKI